MRASQLLTERFSKRVHDTFENKGEPTAYHWHGILQKNTLLHDGVPNVTQESIPRNSVYRYKFIADNTGTLFAHSHLGEQRGYGLANPLIVKEARDPHARMYDYDLTDHIVFIQDFGYNFKSDDADNLLINGHGVQQSGKGGNPHIFEVKPNKRYRFRIIFNGIINIRVLLWIKGLDMTVIALDGRPIKPKKFSSIMMSSAERYDVILNIGNKRNEPYWMHARAYGRSNVTQIAMIKFKKTPTVKWTIKEFRDIQPPEAPQMAWSTFATVANKKLAISPNVLKALNKLPSNLQHPTCKQIFIELTVTNLGFQANNITMQFPKTSYQYQVINSNTNLNKNNFCSIEALNKKSCETKLCSCEHLIKVTSNTCYELVIMGAHPFHLHGHVFHVVAEGVAPQGIPITKESVCLNIID